MAGYVKVYGDMLLNSTVWVCSDRPTKICWITLLCMADQHGIVQSSLPGLAKEADITVEEAAAAIDQFQRPDPHSRTKEYEGRRVEPVDGGWLVLNHRKYRDYRTEDQVKEAERKADYRRRMAEKQEAEEPQVGLVPQVAARRDVTKRDDPIEVVRHKAERARARGDDLKAGSYMVFMYFVAAFGKSDKYIATDKRIDKIKSRLRENSCDVSELFWAVDGALRDDWIMGRDPKARNGGWQEIQTVFRDRDQIDRFLQNVGNPTEMHPTFREMISPQSDTNE